MPQEAAAAKLKVAYEHSKPEARKLQLLGHGNGFSFEASPFCSYAMRDSIHVVLAGEVAEWPGISAVAAAHDGECPLCLTVCQHSIFFLSLAGRGWKLLL